MRFSTTFWDVLAWNRSVEYEQHSAITIVYKNGRLAAIGIEHHSLLPVRVQTPVQFPGRDIRVTVWHLLYSLHDRDRWNTRPHPTAIRLAMAVLSRPAALPHKHRAEPRMLV